MSTYKVQSGESLSTIAAQHGMSVKELQEANGINDPNKIKVGQELSIPQKTPQAKLTEMKIEDAKHQIETLTAKMNTPSLPPAIKQVLKKEIDTLKNVYRNSSVNILPDGSAEFAIKDDMNVEDFKRAYNLQDGVLRGYLNQKHERYFNDPTFHYFTVGSSDDNTEEQDIDDFENKRPGSFREYGDGYKIVTKERFWQPNYHQIDYSGMDLQNGDKIILPGAAVKRY